MKHDAHTAELPLDDPTRPRHMVSNPEKTRKRDQRALAQIVALDRQHIERDEVRPVAAE